MYLHSMHFEIKPAVRPLSLTHRFGDVALRDDPSAAQIAFRVERRDRTYVAKGGPSPVGWGRGDVRAADSGGDR